MLRTMSAIAFLLVGGCLSSFSLCDTELLADILFSLFRHSEVFHWQATIMGPVSCSRFRSFFGFSFIFLQHFPTIIIMLMQHISQNETFDFSHQQPDSPYQGGVFFLTIHFPTDYPFKPPKVRK